MLLADLTAQFQVARTDSPTWPCIDRADRATELHIALAPAAT